MVNPFEPDLNKIPEMLFNTPSRLRHAVYNERSRSFTYRKFVNETNFETVIDDYAIS